MKKPKILTESWVTESLIIVDENGIAQIRIESCGNIRGIDEILTFIRKALE